jgi:hypothetical protein
MRKKLALAVLAVAVAMGSVVPRLRAQDEELVRHYNCFGGYDGTCGVTWIKNCYC